MIGLRNLQVKWLTDFKWGTGVEASPSRCRRSGWSLYDLGVNRPSSSGPTRMLA